MVSKAPLDIVDFQTRLEGTIIPMVPASGAIVVEYLKTAPQITLSRWNRERGFSVRYQGLNGNLVRGGETITWTDGTQVVNAYPIQPDLANEDGGIELEIVLGSLPPSPVFSFVVDGAEGLDFYKQPTISTPTFLVPENVRGSYAVYHAVQRDHQLGALNYQTGKAFHIYRPLAVDAALNTVWCDLDYAGGLLTVTVDANWLTTATYPVVIDPTFGYTTIGGSEGFYNSSELVGSALSTVTDGTVTAMQAHCAQANGAADFKGVILDASHAVITNGITNGTAIPAAYAWTTASFGTNPTITGGAQYRATWINNNGISSKIHQDTATGYYNGSNSYASPSGGAPTDTTITRSVYADYTESNTPFTNQLPRNHNQALRPAPFVPGVGL